MGKLWMMLAVMATLAPIMAQDSAPAPEATAQETCEIAEKDVDTMMDEYIASKGWNEGLNEKNGKKFFVAKGTGVIQAPRESASYIGSRVNAYNKAMLEAKKAMVNVGVIRFDTRASDMRFVRQDPSLLEETEK